MHTHRSKGDPAADVEFPGHCKHALVPSSEYSPTPHARQLEAPGSLTVPPGHSLHVDSLVAFRAAEKRPATQLVHVSIMPVRGTSSKVPAGHARHDENLPLE